MSDEIKCETNYRSTTSGTTMRNKHLIKHDTNDDVDLDNCVRVCTLRALFTHDDDTAHSMVQVESFWFKPFVFKRAHHAPHGMEYRSPTGGCRSSATCSTKWFQSSGCRIMSPSKVSVVRQRRSPAEVRAVSSNQFWSRRRRGSQWKPRPH